MVREEAAFIDPFGAPEFWVNGIARRELVSPDVVRLVWYANEAGEGIIRVKTLITIPALVRERQISTEFLASIAMGEAAGRMM